MGRFQVEYRKEWVVNVAIEIPDAENRNEAEQFPLGVYLRGLKENFEWPAFGGCDHMKPWLQSASPA